MKRFGFKFIILVVTVSIFVVLALEGWIYYSNVEDIHFRIYLNIQNIINAIKLDPEISLDAAYGFMKENEGNVCIQILTHFYALSLLITPFFTATFLLMLIKKPYNWIIGFGKRFKGNKFLIIGKGSDYKKFINALVKDCKLTVVEDTVVDDELLLWYYRNGISLIQNRENMKLKDLINILNINRYKNILLCDSDDLVNYYNLNLISEYYEKKEFNSQQKIYVLCKNPYVEGLISDNISNESANISRLKNNIKIINPKKKAVEGLFKAAEEMIKQDNSYQNDSNIKKDIHVAICGFGEVGQSALIHALNVSILSSDSTILIDVFDKNIENEINSFMKNFASDALEALKYTKEKISEEMDVDCYRLLFPFDPDYKKETPLFSMDGKLVIRFWKMDVNNIEFNKVFDNCHREMPFNYIFVAIALDKAVVDIVSCLKQSMCSSEFLYCDIPILMYSQEKEKMKPLFDSAKVVFSNEDAFSYAALVNQEIENISKIFNFEYQKIYDEYTGYNNKCSDDRKQIKNNVNTIEDIWNRRSLFDKESSIAQAMAKGTWEWLIENSVYTLEDREELQKMEHRRWCYFMLTHGFKYGEKTDKEFKKTHSCLCNWEKLVKTRPDVLEYDYIPFEIIKRENKSNIE
ncbi:MAG: hypothetical protein ACOX1F_05450 [Erysipelotrichaceae bacterium]